MIPKLIPIYDMREQVGFKRLTMSLIVLWYATQLVLGNPISHGGLVV